MFSIHNSYVFFPGESNISIDFDKLEAACGLRFDEELQLAVYDAVYLYLAASINKNRSSWQKLERRIKKVMASIEVLRPVLRASLLPDDFLTMTPEEREAVLLSRERREAQDVSVLTLPKPRPGHPKMLDVDNYLRHWLMRGRKALDRPFPAHRPKDFPLRRYMIPLLHDVYRRAGGKGMGCYAVESEVGKYSGPFYRLVCSMIEQVAPHSSPPSGVGKAIVEVLSGRKSTKAV